MVDNLFQPFDLGHGGEMQRNKKEKDENWELYCTNNTNSLGIYTITFC